MRRLSNKVKVSRKAKVRAVKAVKAKAKRK